MSCVLTANLWFPHFDSKVGPHAERTKSYVCCVVLFCLPCEGHAAGPHHNQGGGGSNFLCLPEEPQWKTHIGGHQTHTGMLYGVEYELFNSGRYHNNIFAETNSGRPLLDNPAACAVCYTSHRSTILMIPARTQCPRRWATEYEGYLVSEFSTREYRKRSSYACWDEAPEIASGGVSQNQAVISPVKVQCGSLPCSTFVDEKELTCVVCSKWFLKQVAYRLFYTIFAVDNNHCIDDC